MADALLSRIGVLCAINETTKGTAIAAASAAIAATGAFMVRDLKFTPDVKNYERKYTAAHASRFSHLSGQCLGQLSFSLELRAYAAAGTEDAYGLLLDACAINDTGTSTVVFKPTSVQSNHKTLTMYAFVGGNGASSMRVGLRGAAGTVKFAGKIGEPVIMEFTFWGVHDRNDADMKPQSATTPTPTHETAVPAVLQDVTLSWGGASTPVSSFSIDVGNTVSARDSIADDEGVLHYLVTDRAMSGSIDPELDLAGTDLDKLNTGTEVALSVTIVQTTPSRTFVIAAPNCQATGVSIGDRNGIATTAVNFGINTAGAAAGDDEFSITIS